MRRRLVVALLAVMALVVGCSSHATTTKQAQVNGPGDASPAQVKAADLAPCPSSPGAGGGLPNLTLPCLGAGPAVHLSGLRGPAVVNVWGSWCPPCQKEIPYFTTAYAADKRTVAFLGVDTVDEADSALNFATHVRPAMHYPSVVDQDKKVLVGLRFPSPPVTVFVSAAGKVVHLKGGAYTSTAELQQDISTYLHVQT